MPTRTAPTELIIHPIAHDTAWLRNQYQNNPSRVFFVSETKYDHLLRLHYVIKNTTSAGEKSYDIKAEVLLRNDAESSAEKIIEKLVALGVLYKSLLLDDKAFLSFALKTYQLPLIGERTPAPLPRALTPHVDLDELDDNQPAPTYPRSSNLFPPRDGKPNHNDRDYGTFFAGPC